MLRSFTALSLLVCWTACSVSGAGSHRSVGKVSALIEASESLRNVTIKNVAGKISVIAVTDQTPSIGVDVLLSEGRPETDFVADFAEHVQMAQEGDSLTLRNRHARTSDQDDWQLHFVVRVPAGISVTIEQTAGEVTVDLPSLADVNINNTAGHVAVNASKIAGKVTITQQTGVVTIKVAENGPANGCTIDCTAGTVTMHLPKDAAGEFDLGAVTGDVHIANRYGLKAERAMASVSAVGQVGFDGPLYRAHVVTGTVDLR